MISGNFGIAKDALAEIASRLRVRTLRDVNAGAEPAPVAPVRSMLDGPPPAAAIGPGRSGGYEPFRGGGGREYEPHNYSVPPAAARYSDMNSSALEAKILKNLSSSAIGAGGSTIFNTTEVSGARLKLENRQTGGSEVFRGSSEHLTATQSIHSFMASSSYQNSNIQRSSYQNMNAQYSPYQNVNAQRSPYQSPYHNLCLQQSPYPLNAEQGAYANFNAPQSAYHNYSAQQGGYHY